MPPTSPPWPSTPLRSVRWIPALLPLLIVACGAQPAGESAEIPPPAPAEALAVQPPIRATHWFGAHWAKNLINAYRREDVAGEFRTIREDGFDTVVLLVSWGDFQPVYLPCCREDERAFQRLDFLLDEAERQGLRVMLRIGFAWSFHPDSPPTLERVHVLMNDVRARAAFQRFVGRVGKAIEGRPQVLMSFMSWEDQWLRHIEPIAAEDYARFIASLPPAERPPDPTRLPRADDDSAPWFHRYWDWLKLEELHRPAQAQIPLLGYEVRSDKEPRWQVDAAGRRKVAGWIDHRSTYRQPGAVPLVMYWAPFWGARNEGESLRAEESLALLGGMLAEASAWSGDRPVFINQFNLIDNTPGHEHNATLPDDQIAPFLRGAVCVLKNHGVLGAGLWTGRDYEESPLYNPSFAYGLEGWHLVDGEGRAIPEGEALLTAPERDPHLRLRRGEVLTQAFGRERGRLPHRDDRPDHACVDALSPGGARLRLQAGGGEPVELALPAGHAGRACTTIDSHPVEDRLAFRVEALEGEAELRGLWLFDHVQDGGLRTVDNRPGRHHHAVIAFNEAMMRSELPKDCR
ncbi:hypothetical protein [Silanimonas lenta]|uniref:hypothetical protein n=1 Tax=Silanimonas lenta TaxID=265429 RepID=UPI000408DEC1|nr:hypothetical protein [Silanimonas lenta]